MQDHETWHHQNVHALFQLPFNDLLFHAHSVHRKHFNPNEVQVSTLLSIKTGLCPEDCKYCPQSVHHNAKVEKQPLMDVDTILAAAKKAKATGATRFCMGAGWRAPKDKDFEFLGDTIKKVKAMGLETCLTLGMLTEQQVSTLEKSGLDYYNHNIDTSPEYYEKIITTRKFQDRIETLKNVGRSNIKVCCGGIMGMGESLNDRVNFLLTLAQLEAPPESIPINSLIRVPGTPLANTPALDPIDFVRIIAVTRIMFPAAQVRLSAGRNEMSESTQALCFFAGANSIHYGEKLLTTPTPSTLQDDNMFAKLGLKKRAKDAVTA